MFKVSIDIEHRIIFQFEIKDRDSRERLFQRFAFAKDRVNQMFSNRQMIANRERVTFKFLKLTLDTN